MIRRKFGIPAQYPVIGSFANFKQQKNHSMLFRAFKLVLESLPEARLVLVGDQVVDIKGRLDGYRAQLGRLVDDLDIRCKCMFLGHQEDVEQLYAACDITALSSLHEGTPNVLLESMACGIPVVATNICDNSYVVKDGETGFLVEVDDVEGMAERLRALLADDTMREEMGQRARNWVVEEFSLEQLARKTETVYLDALSGKRGKCKQGS
jgi:glycosyltransferase involved in cell wall biosynthesis